MNELFILWQYKIVCFNLSLISASTIYKSIPNLNDPDDVYDFEDRLSATPSYFSNYSNAYVKQQSIKGKPEYKELNLFKFRSKKLFKDYMEAADNRAHALVR